MPFGNKLNNVCCIIGVLGDVVNGVGGNGGCPNVVPCEYRLGGKLVALSIVELRLTIAVGPLLAFGLVFDDEDNTMSELTR